METIARLLYVVGGTVVVVFAYLALLYFFATSMAWLGNWLG